MNNDADHDEWRPTRFRSDAPHDQFFEDGEEPPERYDLPDQADGIDVNPNRIRSLRWFGLGMKAVARGGIRVYGDSCAYYANGLIGFCISGPIILGFFGPLFHANITMRWLDHFVRTNPLFKRRARVRAPTSRFALANIAVFLSALLTIAGILFLYSEIGPAIHALNRRPASQLNELQLATIMASIAGIIAIVMVHASVAVRVGGFATHLILDRDLRAFDAIEANWRITSSRTIQLMLVKLALWTVKYSIGYFTCGIGLIMLEPYCAAVWTAAYLDIAGSEPIVENA